MSSIPLDDLMIGHSYFMAEGLEELKLKFNYEIIPLIEEYEKDGLLLDIGDDLNKLKIDYENQLIKH